MLTFVLLLISGFLCSTLTLPSTRKAAYHRHVVSALNSVDKSHQEFVSSLKHQIFCNVELNGEAIEAVGFDMDYTLAQYNTEFDLLAYEGAKKKLCEALGYPDDILKFKYDKDAFRRGLIIDKNRGNILKIDRHKYVRKVYHGLSHELSTDERKKTYGQQVASFTESNYVNIDTLFLLIDAILFAQLVDYRDKNELLIDKTYEQLYKDVRTCVDLCHRDGVIKDTVMSNPAKYIIYDPNMVPMIQKMKSSGKIVFLLTNSLWEYTNVVMNYLVHGGTDTKTGQYKYNNDIAEWESLFNITVVGACKPSFLTDEYLSMFRVDKDGSLHNIEDKDALNLNVLNVNRRVYQGGYWQDLHRMMGIKSGDRILYVGDHMYADILRSKRTLGWRTCLIIPELEHELSVAVNYTAMAQEIIKLRQIQYDLDEYIDLLRSRDRMGLEVKSQLLDAEEKAIELKTTIRAKNDLYNSKFNTFWGQLFKAGYQDSRFSKQVTDYACLYTSKASNLHRVSVKRSFRPIADFMPHEFLENSRNVGLF
jgi:HAD superfamily 5'-nucleotidase-like hydrolase